MHAQVSFASVEETPIPIEMSMMESDVESVTVIMNVVGINHVFPPVERKHTSVGGRAGGDTAKDEKHAYVLNDHSSLW